MVVPHAQWYCYSRGLHLCDREVVELADAAAAVVASLRHDCVRCDCVLSGSQMVVVNHVPHHLRSRHHVTLRALRTSHHRHHAGHMRADHWG